MWLTSYIQVAIQKNKFVRQRVDLGLELVSLLSKVLAQLLLDTIDVSRHISLVYATCLDTILCTTNVLTL